ncbi:DsbA family protein [Aliamphritea spongicola]|uniref:DsbA family protein n=1 Tax=Aliamphritea spongicola TaxID=707589 RepID=UPI00196A2232|nr:DsbA family protein [Aliamphritea spongicola]MBN3562683.1 DsbA family protein [Aliamphritea spongicola]
MALIYVMDPMCSWCWAFQHPLQQLTERLNPDIQVLCYMGGLAPDNDQPMDPELRQAIQYTWQQIEARTGTQFNHDFWTQCQPRRSTYPACRAVISAESMQSGAGMKMIRAIQEAYYLQARNPSDIDTLTELAAETGLDKETFAATLQSTETEQTLQSDLRFSHSIGVQGFPFLAYQTEAGIEPLAVGYCSEEQLLTRAEKLGIIS